MCNDVMSSSKEKYAEHEEKKRDKHIYKMYLV